MEGFQGTFGFESEIVEGDSIDDADEGIGGAFFSAILVGGDELNIRAFRLAWDDVYEVYGVVLVFAGFGGDEVVEGTVDVGELSA